MGSDSPVSSNAKYHAGAMENNNFKILMLKDNSVYSVAGAHQLAAHAFVLLFGGNCSSVEY